MATNVHAVSRQSRCSHLGDSMLKLTKKKILKAFDVVALRRVGHLIHKTVRLSLGERISIDIIFRWI